MWRTMYVQFDFQRGPSWSFLRWPTLIARLLKSQRAQTVIVQAQVVFDILLPEAMSKALHFIEKRQNMGR